MKWADYRNIEINDKQIHKRFQKSFKEEINIMSSNIQGIHIDKDIYLSWLVHKLDSNNKMVSVYIENRRNHIKDNVEKHIFQVELLLSGKEKEVFLS